MEKGIIISSVALSNAFKELSKVKAYKNWPITDSLKLECFPDEVLLSKSNLVNTVQIRLNCEWNSGCSFLLDNNVGALMLKIEEQPVQIRIKDDDDTIVYIQGDDFNVKFVVDKAENFVSHEYNTFNVIGAMDYPVFRSALEKLTPFLSTDELIPAMNGFCFNKDHVTATDGLTLRYIQNPGLKFKGMDDIILRNIIPYLPKPSKILSFGDAYFDISEDKKIIKIEFNDHIIYSKLIDEKYPDYKAVIPNEFNTEFTIENKALKQVTDQALIFANKTTNQVKINVNGKLDFSAEDFDFSNEFNRSIDYIEKSGDDIVFGVNGKLLVKCLKYLDDKVKVELVDPVKPIILNSEVLLMPVMI